MDLRDNRGVLRIHAKPGYGGVFFVRFWPYRDGRMKLG